MKFLLSGVICLIALSCAAQKNKAYYHEDLYQFRPKLDEPVDTVSSTTNSMIKSEVTPQKNVNSQVNSVLDSINRFGLTRKLIDGYTIQIYSGQNREEAMNTKKKMATDLPDLTADLEYQQPKFRVRVGNYVSRLEAQKDLLYLKKYFPNSILIPEKIVAR